MPSSFSRFASAISAFISTISTFSFSSHSSRVGVDITGVLFTGGPFGGIAAFKEMVVDFGDAVGARPALAAHVWLEIGHARLFRLGQGSLKRPPAALHCRCRGRCYIRLSVANKDELYSVENQKRIINQWVAEHALPISHFYIDENHSGSNFDCPAFKQVFEYIDNEHLDNSENWVFDMFDDMDIITYLYSNEYDRG